MSHLMLPELWAKEVWPRIQDPWDRRALRRYTLAWDHDMGL
jgi:hypothetical protein